VSTRDRETCSADERRDVQEVRSCPDCQRPLFEGPHGGLSVNWRCSNPKCGSGFNDMGPFGVERISDASPRKGIDMKTCAACHKPIPRGEANRYVPSVYLCNECEPVANPICTTKGRCECAPSDSPECCCLGVANHEVLHFTPNDNRAMTCENCLAPVVFINVNTGKKLAA